MKNKKAEAPPFHLAALGKVEVSFPLLSFAKSFVTTLHIALTESPVAAYPVSRQVGMA